MWLCVPEVVAAERLAPWEETGEPYDLVEGYRRGGQPPFTLGKEGASAIDHLDPKATCFGMCIHESDDLVEYVFAHHRIRVQQDHILRIA